MSELVLYDYWRSSAAYRVRIAMNLKGLSWTSHSVDLAAGEQGGDAHLSRNPLGLVPVLEVDGEAIAQSLAIIEYLDARWPEPRLLPADPMARAHVLGRAMTIIRKCTRFRTCGSRISCAMTLVSMQPGSAVGSTAGWAMALPRLRPLRRSAACLAAAPLT